jgi:hypothetical protein
MNLHFEEVCEEFWMQAWIPSSSSEPREWVVRCFDQQGGKQLVEKRIPMDYAPVFGPDVSDVQTLILSLDDVLADARKIVEGKNGTV